MAATLSTMLPLGTEAPDFSLPDTDGRIVSRDDYTGAPALLVLFLCNHCPYVKHVQQELVRIGTEYGPRGVAIIAISSNDVEQYPQDGPAAMKAEKERVGYPFPYLFDESQDIARAYQAACTPDIFLFDGTRRLVYRGQLDDSRPANGKPVTGRDLRAALDATLEGRTIPEDQQVPSMGCNIKWKSAGGPGTR